MLSRHLKRWVKQDPFTLLGLHPSSSSEDVKIAYYKLAKKYHPDINSHYKEYFREISLAYREIIEMGDRRSYFEEEKPAFEPEKEPQRRPRHVPRPRPVPDDDRKAKRYALMETVAIVVVVGFILIRILLVVSSQQKELLLKVHKQCILDREKENDASGLDKYYSHFEEIFSSFRNQNK